MTGEDQLGWFSTVKSKDKTNCVFTFPGLDSDLYIRTRLFKIRY